MVETRCLTIDFNTLAELITTEVIIQPAFDPGYIKESEISYAAFLALVDTGTTMSVISPRVIETLQLKPIGRSFRFG
jgi:hypothetical protein